MARRDWYYQPIPKELAERLDDFCGTPKAKRMGINNKSELIRFLLDKFLENHRFD